MRQIILDTETTGLSKTAKITEFAAIETINYEPIKHMQMHLNPTIPIDPEAARITGLTNAFLNDKPLFKEKVEEILNFIGNSPIVAHNAKFDMRILNYELSLLNKPSLPNQVIDTLTIARQKHPGERVNLDALYKKYFGTSFKRKEHSAIEDSYMLLKVYQKLIGYKSQINLKMQQKKQVNSTRKNKIKIDTPIITASEQELQALKTFQEHFFNKL